MRLVVRVPPHLDQLQRDRTELGVQVVAPVPPGRASDPALVERPGTAAEPEEHPDRSDHHQHRQPGREQVPVCGGVERPHAAQHLSVGDVGLVPDHQLLRDGRNV